MPPPLNTALVGFGYAGRTVHAPLIASVSGLRLHSVVSTRPQAARTLWPEARVTPDIETVLADPAVDLVVVATPNDTHAPLASRALAAGKHVVVDKPFALTGAQARALNAEARAAKRLLSVFHNRRWDADFLAVQALVAGGRLGEIGRFESRFERFRPIVRDRWRERPGPGAGLWFDLGPHLIDQALTLFGRPLGVTADIAAQRAGGGAADYAHAVLRYERLRVILHADMLSAAQPFRFVVHGARATYVSQGLDPQEGTLKGGGRPGESGWGVDPSPGVVVDGDTGVSEVFAGPPGDYRRYYEAVASAIADGAPNPVTPDEAIAVMDILEAGERSSAARCEMGLT